MKYVVYHLSLIKYEDQYRFYHHMAKFLDPHDEQLLFLLLDNQLVCQKRFCYLVL
ncbi:hypothetical protein HanIR_Chr06g0274571 [Helianthus annuus]|nr:hypothetical protein HanIR_Chr06g0274571 [Helianthus annuus]